ncbi:NIPA-like protein [Xenopus laevis]|uniref:Zinc finger C3HC-type protein 1-like n=1 Tax=Xenopus laevis TaxID=8355 RepID=ZC3C1_XENLA|nr:zinc finger C3HC-type protein 1-like [Xenopus laevis]Q6P7H4.1 RecName: Full=Zinc finger C3HC-type protein 1-like; AltName: Full=NIPA-like protein [Xenopus laevis]AAH61669.1 MGC68711 protein [Xenopus laevis]
MATTCEEVLVSPVKSTAVTPLKIRELINEGIVCGERSGIGRKEASETPEENTAFEDLPGNNSYESTSKDAFFSRVESFSSLKWAGKPPELCPLICAKYGWCNIECDMLKCSSCNAYLCASLQPILDFSKYKQRCVELQEALRKAHEKFCFWPDSPCPEHFWALLVTEPSSVLSDFVERFHNLCHLEMQLPSLKHEDVKSMDITEDTVSRLLRLIEDELKPKEGREANSHSLPSDSLQVHISACILALCGWNTSFSSGSLCIINCPRCMRKVGLWAFQQLETVELDNSLSAPGTPVSPAEGHERSPLGFMSPSRRVTRSRDAEQSPAFAYGRTRSSDLLSPADSEAVRNRPVTRSMGQGENTGLGNELHSSPHRRAKRPRLCSSSSSDTSPRSCFDPLSQHRSWCPWVNVCQASGTNTMGSEIQEEARRKEYGWKEVLKVLLAEENSRTISNPDTSSVPEKSHKVFRIFRQWQLAASS